jgi:hypothetical protein
MVRGLHNSTAGCAGADAHEDRAQRRQVFGTTNLRKARQKRCVAAGLGTLTEVDGKADPRYTGLIIHDPRRSAIKKLMKVCVNGNSCDENLRVTR